MSKSAQNCYHLQAETPCAAFWESWEMVSSSPKPKIRNMKFPGWHSIPKIKRDIWDRGKARSWHEFVWLMDGNGRMVKWIVDEAGRSALMSPIPLICSRSSLAGSNSSVTHQSSQCLATWWCNCSLILNHPELALRRKNHFVPVGSLLASAFPWLQSLQLFRMGVGQTPSLKGQAHVHSWLEDSGGRYQCGDTGQLHLCNSTNRQGAVQGVSACRWRQFWALFHIYVDLESVSIMLIFILYQKSDLVSCLRNCCSCYKNQ